MQESESQKERRRRSPSGEFGNRSEGDPRVRRGGPVVKESRTIRTLI